MEKCTIHRLKMLTAYREDWIMRESAGIKKLTVPLGHFVDFDEPVPKDCSRRRYTINITPLNTKWFLENEFLINTEAHFHLFLFITSWVLAEHDRAVQIEVNWGRGEHRWQLDFIEFGVKTKSPDSIIKLGKCFKKKKPFRVLDPRAQKSLNEHFPNCLSKSKSSDSRPFWIRFESNFEPTIEFSPSKPTWLDRSIDLKDDTCETPHEWMNDIISCFTIFVKLRTEFGIALKKVNEEDTQLIFYVHGGNPVNFFSFFLGTLNNFKKKPKKFNYALLKWSIGLMPFVSSGLIIKDAVDNFKTGNPKTATCQLILGTASLVADAFLLAEPASSLVAKAVQSSPKVLKACTTIANVTSKANIVTRMSKSAINVAEQATKKVSNDPGCSNVKPGKRVQISDPDLLRTVFPRLAEDIL